MLEFPSSDAAHDWENSAQYQAIVKVRTQNTTSPFVIIDGVPEYLGYNVHVSVLAIHPTARLIPLDD